METIYSIKEEDMETINSKAMHCCDYVIIPKVNTRHEPYTVRWKCPKCGNSMKQIINGSNLVLFDIAESINIKRAIPDS